MSSKPQKQIDPQTLTRLLRDPVIARIVTVLDIASLSVLELLEYGMTREQISHALAEDIIEMNETMLPKSVSIEGMFVAGDMYFYQFLNSKVHLTAVGRYILDCLKEGQFQTEQELEKAMEKFDPETFSLPRHPQGPGQ